MELAEDGPVPKQLLALDHPFPDYLEPVLEAFEFLSRGRPWGFAGPQPIAVSECLAYLWAVPLMAPRPFLGLIQAADSVFLAWSAEQRSRTKETP